MKTSWAQWVFLGLGLAGLGCEETQTQTIDIDVTIEPKELVFLDGGADESSSGSSSSSGSPIVDPCLPYEQTTLPSMGVGDVLIVCSACSDTCSILGGSCESYGALCDADGFPGVCISCCAGIVGELRCSTL